MKDEIRNWAGLSRRNVREMMKGMTFGEFYLLETKNGKRRVFTKTNFYEMLWSFRTDEKLVNWLTLCEISTNDGGMFPDWKSGDDEFVDNVSSAISEMIEKAGLMAYCK